MVLVGYKHEDNIGKVCPEYRQSKININNDILNKNSHINTKLIKIKSLNIKI